MRILVLISIFIISLFSFEVKFEDSYQKNINPSLNAFLLETSNTIKNIPFKYFRVDSGYVVIGDDNVDEWLRNTATLPIDTYIKPIKVAIVDMDKIRVRIINKLNKNYEKCSLSKIEFLNSPKELYLKAKTINIKTKVTLECEK